MIEVRNSSIIIHNYELGSNKVIERYLSVYEKMKSGFFLTTFSSFIYDEENSNLIIPRGYDIGRLKKIMQDDEVIYSKKTDQSRNILLNMTCSPRDTLQEEAISFLLSEGNYSNLLYDTQKFLCLKTGKGKSYCMINAICQMKKRAMIIVDSLTISDQWKNYFLQYTDIKEKDICMLSGIKSVNKVLSEKSFEPSYKIYIATHQTLNSLYKREPKYLTNFFNKIKIGVKVYDEAHTSWQSIFCIDGYTNTARTFYLTATPGRSDPNENRLYNYVFENVPVFGREECSSSNYRYETNEVNNNEAYHIVYYISYDSKPSYNDQIELTKQGRFNLNGYSDYIKTKIYDKFLGVIMKIIDLALKRNDERKICILLIKNDMIQKLYEDLSNAYPDLTIGRFCGLVPKKDKYKEKEKRIIISTEKSLGKAEDIPNLGYLINTIPFSSSVISEQVIGRLRRCLNKNSFLFDIADHGFKNCKNNQKYRSNTFNKIAKKIRMVSFDEEE